MSPTSTPQVRTVFISDLHLGSRHCQPEALADFLATLRCDRLYLVGDIVDVWEVTRRRACWAAPENRVVAALHALARDGCELVYIPGNHDRTVRRLCGLALRSLRMRRHAVHVTADGRRLLVTHGDRYDAQTQFGGLQERLGDWLYDRILTGNRLVNGLRRRVGLRYWSLAAFLKRQSGAAEDYIARFVEAGLADARRRGLDGIVCGHIHRAALECRDGMVYANDGDWVESLTALVELRDGTLQLWSHRGEVLARLPPQAGRAPDSTESLLRAA